jgi:hypothetical protein
MKFKENLYKNVLIISSLILLLNLAFRLVDQSQLISSFPLDFTNDWSSYMAQLFFLKECGFQSFCPYWFNGFTTFLLISPAWFFFVYPFYSLTNNVLLTIYLSLLVTYVSFFVLFISFGKLLKLSRLKSIFFFTFFAANAIAIGNFVRLGRIHEFFGLFFLIFLIFLFLHYRNKSLDKKSLLIFPIYTIVILSHQTTAILASIFIFSFFLTRNVKEKAIISFYVLLSLIASSFWWVPYISNFFDSLGKNIVLTENLLTLNPEYLLQNIATTFISLAVLLVFYLYVKSNNLNFKKEFIFFHPVLILSLLLLTRILVFIPVIKYVYPDSYNYIFIFFILFFFLKTNLDYFKKNLRNILTISILFISILSIFFNIVHTPLFVPHSPEDKLTLETLEYVDGKFMIVFFPEQASYAKAYYSYAPIYLNLSTPHGWYSYTNQPYMDIVQSIGSYLQEKDCTSLVSSLTNLNTSNLITYNEHCATLRNCGLIEVHTNSPICLYKLQ